MGTGWASNGALYAGVELGGTKCVAILARGPDEVIAEVRLATTAPQETLPQLAALLGEWAEAHPVQAIGIASFGPLELDRRRDDYGCIVSTPKPGWSGVDLVAALTRPGLPCRLDTDVNGAALAEGRWGAAQNLASFAYVTVGTGIGVGSVVDGRCVTGLGHSEAGHQRVPRLPGDDWPGACPYHGDCVEGLAAAPALQAATEGGIVTAPDDDPALIRAAAALAAMFHNLVLTTCPERILVGGGIATARPALLEAIRRRLNESLGGYFEAGRIAADTDFIRAPGLDARAGPLGAIALAMEAAAAG